MSSLKIHIDLANKDHIALVTDVVQRLAWEVVPGAPATKPPDILVILKDFQNPLNHRLTPVFNLFHVTGDGAVTASVFVF